MLPRGIIHRLLQSLLLITLPSLLEAKEFNGFRGNNCVELDASVVEDLISTLKSSGNRLWKNGLSENSGISIPLETSESDWKKLKTVADALPEHSDLDVKLKRLLSLLVAARDQAISNQNSLALDVQRLIPMTVEEEESQEKLTNASKNEELQKKFPTQEDEHREKLTNSTKNEELQKELTTQEEEHREKLTNTTKNKELQTELTTQEAEQREKFTNATKNEDLLKELTTQEEEQREKFTNATKNEDLQKELTTQEEEHLEKLTNATKNEKFEKEFISSTTDEQETSIQNSTDSSVASVYNETENYKTYNTVNTSDVGTAKNEISETSIGPATASESNFPVLGLSTISNKLTSFNSITNDPFLSTTKEISDSANESIAINSATVTVATESWITAFPIVSHRTTIETSAELNIVLKDQDFSSNDTITNLSKQSESSTISNTQRSSEIMASKESTKVTESFLSFTSATKSTSTELKLQTDNSVKESTEQMNHITSATIFNAVNEASRPLDDSNRPLEPINRSFNSSNSSPRPSESVDPSVKPPEVLTEFTIASTAQESTTDTDNSNSTFQYFSTSPTPERFNFVKNLLHTNAPKTSNNILRNFKHNDDNSVSKQITLYEIGSSGGKNGRIWRPQLVGRPPSGNSIWNTFNHHHEESKPDAASISTPGYDYGRMFLPHPSRKRASPNAEVDRTLRRFYNRGQMDPPARSRNRNEAKLNIQCSNAKRRRSLPRNP